MPVAETAQVDVSAAKRAISALVRTERTVRTYPIGNQLSQNALRDLLPKMADALPLNLWVRRDQLVWNDVPLLDSENDRSDMPGRLYNDGVRILRLSSGIDADELERFVVALSTPIHPDDLTEDYVTRLWEAELPNIHIVAVDPYPDLDVPDEVLEGKFRPTEEVEDIGPLPEEELDIPAPPDEAFRIAADDMARVAQEIEHTRANPPWSIFMIALFDLMRDNARADRIEQLVSLLEATFQRTLQEGRVDVASELLLRIRTHVPTRAAQAVREALFRMGHPDRLQPLHEALENGSCEPEAAERVFVLLGEWVPELPCALLAESRTQRSRRFYADVLAKIGVGALEPVLQHIHTAAEPTQPYFARVLRELGDSRATPTLISLSGSGTSALRKEALRGLTHMPQHLAEPVLTRTAFHDADPSVRIVALMCLAGLNAAVEWEPLIARVSSADARALPDKELDLLYLAIGATHRPEALRFLSERLRPGWLRGRGDAKARMRAARGLARMQLAEARQELEKGARSGKRDLAEICARALEQGGAAK
ncbi:MAG: hypothetical protein V3V67_11245 [Myxococcota bacterium]